MSISSHGNIHTHTFVDSEADASAELDLLGGVGSLFSLEVDNTDNTVDVFVKVWDNASPTVGTTAPDIVLKVPASEKIPFLLGSAGQGIALATGLSVACVTTGGTGGTTSPPSKVEVTLRTD